MTIGTGTRRLIDYSKCRAEIPDREDVFAFTPRKRVVPCSPKLAEDDQELELGGSCHRRNLLGIASKTALVLQDRQQEPVQFLLKRTRRITKVPVQREAAQEGECMTPRPSYKVVYDEETQSQKLITDMVTSALKARAPQRKASIYHRGALAEGHHPASPLVGTPNTSTKSIHTTMDTFSVKTPTSVMADITVMNQSPRRSNKNLDSYLPNRSRLPSRRMTRTRSKSEDDAILRSMHRELQATAKQVEAMTSRQLPKRSKSTDTGELRMIIEHVEETSRRQNGSFHGHQHRPAGPKASKSANSGLLAMQMGLVVVPDSSSKSEDTSVMTDHSCDGFTENNETMIPVPPVFFSTESEKESLLKPKRRNFVKKLVQKIF